MWSNRRAPVGRGVEDQNLGRGANLWVCMCVCMHTCKYVWGPLVEERAQLIAAMRRRGGVLQLVIGDRSAGRTVMAAVKALLLPARIAPPLAQVTALPARVPAKPPGLELELVSVTSLGSVMVTSLLCTFWPDLLESVYAALRVLPGAGAWGMADGGRVRDGKWKRRRVSQAAWALGLVLNGLLAQ